MELTVLCDCGATNSLALNDDVDVFEDVVRCTCGKPLPIEKPRCAPVKWKLSRLSGPTMDPVTGAFRWSVVILPEVGEGSAMIAIGSVARVFGDTEFGALAVAKHMCNAHNRFVDETLAANPIG